MPQIPIDIRFICVQGDSFIANHRRLSIFYKKILIEIRQIEYLSETY